MTLYITGSRTVCNKKARLVIEPGDLLKPLAGGKLVAELSRFDPSRLDLCTRTGGCFHGSLSDGRLCRRALTEVETAGVAKS
jgi:hypothetical protein